MTDYISRADAIEAVRKEYEDAINIGDNGDAIAYDVERLLSALPSADAISREEYEDIIKDYRKQYEDMNNEIADLEAKLSAVPNCQKCAIKELWQETEKEDLVSVVRCKDCIHWKADNEVFELGFCCVFPQKWVAETFYCADGERREP